MAIKNRIKELTYIKASELVQNPKNWRMHPEAQQNALRGVLNDVGYVDALIARPLSEGKYELVDGHLRASMDPDEEVPVLVVDLNDEESDKILATFDPLAAMATTNNEQLDKLLSGVHTDDDALAKMLEGLSKDVEPIGDHVESDGSLLKLADVTMAEPKHQVTAGQIWHLGKHVLLCVDVLREWPIWKEHLSTNDSIFCPYPGPFIALAKDINKRLVMVQPDPYAAGHIVDRYAEIHGEDSVKHD